MTKQDEKIELMMKVFENLRSLISHADGKAGIALGLQTFISMSVLSSTLVASALNDVNSLGDIRRFIFYFLFSGFVTVSIVNVSFCILVFKPRPPQEESEKNRDGLTYFGHISRYKNSSEYLKAVKKSVDTDLLEDLGCQNYTLAVIVNHKMKFSRYSVNTLFLSIFLGILLLFFVLLTK